MSGVTIAEEFSNVGAIISVSNRGYLFQLRDDKPNIVMPNRWGLFGGHVEEGETTEAAVIREVKEELSVSLEDPKKLCEMVYRRVDQKNEPVWVKRTFFLFEIDESVLAEMKQCEGADMDCLSLEDYLRLDNIIPWDVYGLLSLNDEELR
jgi:8-oxo-dGTP pyrophosphatase MutT (NUDIX family)